MVSNASLTWQLGLTEEHSSYRRWRGFLQDTEICGIVFRDWFLVFLTPLVPQLAAVPGMMRGWKRIGLPDAFMKWSHLAREKKRKGEKRVRRISWINWTRWEHDQDLAEKKKYTSGSSSASKGEQWLLSKPHAPPTHPDSSFGWQMFPCRLLNASRAPPMCKMNGLGQRTDMGWFDPVFSSLFPIKYTASALWSGLAVSEATCFLIKVLLLN